MSGLNHAGSDRQPQGESPRVIQAFSSIGQVAVTIAHGGFFIRSFERFQVLLQRRNDFLMVSSSQSVLLGSAPGIDSAGSAAQSRRPQIFADVIKSHRKVPCFRNTSWL